MPRSFTGVAGQGDEGGLQPLGGTGKFASASQELQLCDRVPGVQLAGNERWRNASGSSER